MARDMTQKALHAIAGDVEVSHSVGYRAFLLATDGRSKVDFYLNEIALVHSALDVVDKAAYTKAREEQQKLLEPIKGDSTKILTSVA